MGNLLANAESNLAIHGGTPAMTCGPFDWPPHDEAVQAALEAAFQSGDWGRYHGARCERLVRDLGERFDVEYAQLTCSGTIAVELALRAVGVSVGDEVLLAGYDFPGNFRAIEAIGARPVLVDLEPNGWGMDIDAVQAAGSDPTNAGVRAVLISHLHGSLTPMDRVVRIARSLGWAVVEDACQAPGASVGGKPVGSWGDAGVLSFGGSKLLTAGRGGALLTNNANIAQRAKVYANRGNDAFAMSELQAAVLLPQLDRLADRNAKRAVSAAMLTSVCDELATCSVTSETAQSKAAYYKVAWRLCERLRSTRDEILNALQAEGAPIDAGFRGFSKRSGRRCRRLGELANAEAVASGTLLLHHPVLLGPPRAVTEVGEAIEKVLAYFAE